MQERGRGGEREREKRERRVRERDRNGEREGESHHEARRKAENEIYRETGQNKKVAFVGGHVLPPTHLVVVVEDTEVSDGEDDFVQQVLVGVMRAVPQQVARDVAELQ